MKKMKTYKLIEGELNAVEILGPALKEIGIDKVKFVPNMYISNELTQVTIFLSYKHFDRLSKYFKKFMVEHE